MSTLTFPDFDSLTPEIYAAEFERLMAEQLRTLDQIAADTAAPSPQNVIAPWERSEAALNAVANAFYALRGSDTSPELDAVAEKFAPLFAAHSDEILLNKKLYARLESFEQHIDELDEQDAHWLAQTLKEFRRGGIGLPDDQQARLRELNATLASLSTKWETVVVAGRNEHAVLISDEAELAGLDDDAKAVAKQAAEARSVDGWLLELVNTTGQDWLTMLDDQATRRRVFEASISRGLSGEHDTRAMIIEMAQLRAEKAALLGYPNYAEYVASDGTAGSVAALMDVLNAVRDQAMPAAQRDAEHYREAFAKLAPGLEFGPWDWQWVAAHEREQFSVSDETLRPYLPLEQVLQDGIFAEAKELYGVSIVEQPGEKSYVADARVFHVTDEDGTLVGGLVFDPWARATKQGGAWMSELVTQSHLLDDLPIVTLNCNYTKPTGDAPALLTWDDVETLFHEFGHCLNGLFSDARYPSRAGANGPRDYVEFPSQVNEQWKTEPSLIARYARHWQTGEPLPSEIVEKLLAGQKFDMAWSDVETVGAMLLDQAWHTTAADELPKTPDEVEAFEQTALERMGVANELIPPRYRSTYFSHIWGNDYCAAYYGYMWSAKLDADSVAWFAENGGMTRANGDAFRHGILAVGDRVDLMDNYRAFRGRDADVRYLLERHQS